MGGFFTFLGFMFLAFVGFVIYFIFKQMQFVIQAVDLYKDMVLRLDKIIQILSANPAMAATLSAQLSPRSVESGSEPKIPAQKADSGPLGICPNCDAPIPISSEDCPKCKANFGPGRSWKIKPY